MAAGVSPFPWRHLETVPRPQARLAGRLRPHIAAALRRERITDAVSKTLSGDVTILVERVSHSVAPVADDRTVFLSFARSALTIGVVVERELGALAIARRLGRAIHLTKPEAPLDPTLGGALAALVLDVARRIALTAVALARPPEPNVSGMSVTATVFIDGRAYGTTLWAHAAEAWSEPLPPALTLEQLGSLPVTLPLVAASSTATLADVGAWEAGDIWLPGEGWTVRSVTTDADRTRLSGRLALAAGASERGIWVDCSSDGQLVLTRDVAALSADPAEGSSEDMGAGSNMTDEDTTLADTVLDAPVVVRVEVGSVTLAAREWAALGKGDVIETGVRIGEPVVLRVSGTAIARGELVSVDGKLGVRVLEMLQAGTDA